MIDFLQWICRFNLVMTGRSTMKKSWLQVFLVGFIMTISGLCVVLSAPVYGETSMDEKDSLGDSWIFGSFAISPQFSLVGGYDSNIYAASHDRVSDRFLILSPGVEISSTWTTHKLKLSTGADLKRFDKNPSENTKDYWLNGTGRYDLSNQSNIFGGMSFSQEHEERGSPDDTSGREPALYLSSSFHLGTEFVIHNLGFRMGGTLKFLDFDDVPTWTSSVDNDDRDRCLYGAGIRASVNLQERTQPFVQLIYDQRSYDQSLDYAGFSRDSKGYRTAVGVKSRWDTLSSEMYVGYLWQEYKDSRFNTIEAFDIGTTVSWKPRPSTKLTVGLERELNETTLPVTSGYLASIGRMKLVQKFCQRWTFSGQVYFSQDEYQEISRKDKNLNAGFGFKYDLSRWLYLSSDYQFSKRSSNTSPVGEIDGNDFHRHQVFVSLGLHFQHKK